MITGKDLTDWGLKPGPVFKTAIKVLAVSRKDFGRPEAEAAVRAMVADPSKFANHPVLSPVAKVLIAESSKPVSESLKQNGCGVKIYGQEMIEAGALSQIYACSKLPIAVKAALMPDAHSGYGLPIGGVLATDNAVIPYAVGVDIACRMQMTILDFPSGRIDGIRDRLENVLKENTVFGAGVDIDKKIEHPILDDPRFNSPVAKKLNVKSLAARQIGTSGGGNHFVEFGVVTGVGMPSPILAVLSHSGSRGVGFNIANEFTRIAMAKRQLPGDAKHLSWLSLDEDEGQEYWEAMHLAGDFAAACHDVIHGRIAKALGFSPLIKFSNHHNFAWKEVVDGRTLIVHRKGATPANPGIYGLIPGSMTTPSYVVSGLGNPDSICSSSHGAGRAMSRKAAKEKYTMNDLRDNLAAAGVTLVGGSVDECSMAYKDIEAVMTAQNNLVRIEGSFIPKVVRMSHEQKKPWEKE